MKKYKYWTKKKCIDIAKTCKSRSDFKKNFSGAWNCAYNNDWLDDIYKFLINPENLTIKWTKEKCKLICDKYTSYNEFIHNEPKVYNAILAKNWSVELCQHMIKTINPDGFWTVEKCYEESQKYNSKSEWIKKSSKSYSAARRNKCVDYCSKHMKKLGNNFHRRIYSFEFDDNHVYVGLTYSIDNRKQYHLSNPKSSVYKHIIKTGLIPKFKILTTQLNKDIASNEEGAYLENYIKNNWIVLNKIKTGGLGGSSKKWTKSNCILEALKYKTRTEFKKLCGGAYSSARRNGWLDDCCVYMKYEQLPNGYWKYNKNKCILEAKKYKNMYQFRINTRGAYNAVVENGWYNEFKNIFK